MRPPSTVAITLSQMRRTAGSFRKLLSPIPISSLPCFPLIDSRKADGVARGAGCQPARQISNLPHDIASLSFNAPPQCPVRSPARHSLFIGRSGGESFRERFRPLSSFLPSDGAKASAVAYLLCLTGGKAGVADLPPWQEWLFRLFRLSAGRGGAACFPARNRIAARRRPHRIERRGSSLHISKTVLFGTGRPSIQSNTAE